MRILGGLFFAMMFAGGLSAQYRGNVQPHLTGGPGNAVFPGGTADNNPGLVRVTPSAAYPGGGGPRLILPGTTTGQARRRVPGTSYVYAYPIYVPLYDPSAYAEPAPAAATAPTQPATTICSPSRITRSTRRWPTGWMAIRCTTSPAETRTNRLRSPRLTAI